jgi:hypothetical protein
MIRWIGFRKCRESPKVPMIVATPIIEKIEATRSTIVRVCCCSSVSPMLMLLLRWRRHRILARRSTGDLTYNTIQSDQCPTERGARVYLLSKQGCRTKVLGSAAVCADNTYFTMNDVLPDPHAKPLAPDQTANAAHLIEPPKRRTKKKKNNINHSNNPILRFCKA